MNKNTKRISRGPGRPSSPNRPSGIGLELRDFEQLAGETLQIEHQTIPGYLRRIPHKWHLNDITRFGDQVGRVAEAMQLAYITASEKSLGTIRVFPLPLLQRVYTIMAPSFNWPIVVEGETAALEDGRRALRDDLRKHERADQDLSSIAEHVDNVEVLNAVQTVREFLTTDIARLRQQIDSVAAGVSPADSPAE